VIELPEKIRAFVAIRIGMEVEGAISRFVDTLRELRSGVRWVRPTNLHLTLRFLGNAVDADLLHGLHKRLSEIAAHCSPFTVAVRGTGAFPNLNRPRTLWLGLVSDELLRMGQQVEAGAVKAGFAPEARPYSPHLTIGRVRDLHGWLQVRRVLEEALSREFGSCETAEMILYRSILGGEASQYQELARYRLSGAAER
jgi:RNA 2',3'-cyclic 3'-phosphodiesterase